MLFLSRASHCQHSQSKEILLILWQSVYYAVSSGVCNFGSTEVPETNFLDDGGQYLDFGHPATCNGNLTAWHFCYYAADITESFTYVVWFRTWRMVDAINFVRIHDYQLSMMFNPPSSETLICETATLSTPLDVQENDILGAFIPFTLLFGPALHIVANDTEDFGLFADTRGTDASFLTTVSRDNLESRTTLGLHLYADIGKILMQNLLIVCRPLMSGIN